MQNDGVFAGVQNTSVAAFVDSKNNTTLSAKGAYLQRDFEQGEASIGERQDVSAKVIPNDDGSFDVELIAFGRTVMFTADDLNANGSGFYKDIDEDNALIYLWTAQENDTWLDVINDEAAYNFVTGYEISEYDEDTDVNRRLLGVVGLRTHADDVPVSGSAEYTGEVLALAVFADSPSASDAMDGDLTLNVSFGDASTISGEIVNFGSRNDKSSAVNLDLAETQISDSGDFELAVILDDNVCGNFCNGTVTAEMHGALYGDQAQELGGDFSATATSTDENIGTMVINGNFLAKQ